MFFSVRSLVVEVERTSQTTGSMIIASRSFSA